MSEFSEGQLEQIRRVLTASGASATCPACGHPNLVPDRARYALFAVDQSMRNPSNAEGGAVGLTGKVATCVSVNCGRCGYMRLHSLSAIGLDNMI